MVETRKMKGKEKEVTDTASEKGHGKRKRGRGEEVAPKKQKRPSGAFVLFCNELKERESANAPVRGKRLVRAKELWLEMTEEQRAPYKAVALVEYKKFKEHNPQSSTSKKTPKKDRGLLFRCSPSRFGSLVSKLSEEKRSAIRAIGFGGLLDVGSVKLPAKLVNWLFTSFDPWTCRLKVDGGEFDVTEGDVRAVFGLPDSGPLPEEAEGGVVPGSIPSHLPIRDLMQQLETMDVGPEFTIKFVLFAYGCLLCPTSKLDIATAFWPYVSNIEKIKDMNWCRHIMMFLCKQLQVGRKKKEKEEAKDTWIGGCIYFLAILYFDRVSIVHHSVQRTHPCVRAWGTMEFSRRISLELKHHGQFGRGKLEAIRGTGSRSAPVPPDIRERPQGSVPTFGDCLARLEGAGMNDMAVELRKLVGAAMNFAGMAVSYATNNNSARAEIIRDVLADLHFNLGDQGHDAANDPEGSSGESEGDEDEVEDEVAGDDDDDNGGDEGDNHRDSDDDGDGVRQGGEHDKSGDGATKGGEEGSAPLGEAAAGEDVDMADAQRAADKGVEAALKFGQQFSGDDGSPGSGDVMDIAVADKPAPTTPMTPQTSMAAEKLSEGDSTDEDEPTPAADIMALVVASGDSRESESGSVKVVGEEPSTIRDKPKRKTKRSKMFGSAEYCATYTKAKCSALDRKLCAFLWDKTADKAYIVAEMHRFWLSRRDIRTLFHDSWVSNSVVQMYGRMLNYEESLRESHRFVCDPTVVDRIMGRDRFEQSTDSEIVNSIGKHLTLESTMLDLSKCYLYFFPTLTRSHWLLYVFDRRAKSVDVLDSLRSNVRPGETTLVKHVARVMRLTTQAEYGRTVDMAAYPVRAVDVPHQSETNANDCGVFLLRFLRHWDGRLNTTSISEDNIRYDRVSIASEIVKSPQNKRRDIVMHDAGIQTHS